MIPGNLYLEGSFVNTSDVKVKENISKIEKSLCDNILHLEPSQFTFKNDPLKKIHYGFIAQEFEEYLPLLVTNKPDKNVKNLKAINYLEMIPLLVDRIQRMQKEIDELKKG